MTRLRVKRRDTEADRRFDSGTVSASDKNGPGVHDVPGPERRFAGGGPRLKRSVSTIHHLTGKVKEKRMAKKTVKVKKAKRPKKSTELVKVDPDIGTIIDMEAIDYRKKALSESEIIEAFDILGITAKLDSQKKKALFVAVAKAMKLNPLLGELHAAEMGGVLVPVTGYQVYIDRAERSRRLEWWDVEESGDIILGSDWKNSTYKCTLVVKRRDWPRAWHYSVRFVEAVGLKDGLPNSMWNKRPWMMTWKCAVAGLRHILKEELGDLPYIDAEVDGQALDEYAPAPIAEPQAKNGAKTNAEGVLDVPGVEIRKPNPAELEAARREVQSIYTRMAKPLSATADGKPDRLFTQEELLAFKEQAVAATDDLARLRSMAIDWNLAYTNRLADRGFGDDKK